METDDVPGIRNQRPSPTWYRCGQRKELSRWEIPLCGELTDRQADLLEQVAEVPRNSRGLMYFDSCGGSVYTGLALATLMRVRGLRVTGVVIGECSSAALLPFAACQKRFVTAHSTLLFHPMRWQSDEDVRLEEATEWARHFKDLESRLDTLVLDLFGVVQPTLHGWTRPGRFVSGPELAEAGLAELFDPFKNADPWKTICAQ
jgi:ATP-dependent protease ClpP protease subunit